MRRTILLLAAALTSATLAGCSNDDLTAPAKATTEVASQDKIGVVRPPFFDPNQFWDITAGDGFTCARKANGYVYCWGRNDYYQTGRTGTVTQPKLVKKSDGTPLITIQVDAGYDHACAIEANTSLGWCWGAANDGQTGFAPGTYSTAILPTPVHGGRRFNSISAGFRMTCASGPDGFFCWGLNLGQRSGSPLLISTFNRYSNVTVGDLHACGIDTLDPARAVDCFGGNHEGQAGIPFPGFSVVPFTLRAQFGDAIDRVVTQGKVTCVDQAGTVKCVGSNYWGQLGNGNTMPTSGNPTTLLGSPQLRGVSVSPVHGCAIDTTSQAWCWGYGYDGQVGVVPYTRYTSPVLVRGGYTYRAVAAGNQHSCGIGTNNAIICWGYNSYGQVGQGYADYYGKAPAPTLAPVDQ